jgi:hypothetical protein
MSNLMLFFIVLGICILMVFLLWIFVWPKSPILRTGLLGFGGGLIASGILFEVTPDGVGYPSIITGAIVLLAVFAVMAFKSETRFD